MIHGRLLCALLVAAVIAVAGWTVAPGADEAGPELVPAPPPATCRIAPPSTGWAGYAEDPGSSDLTPFQDYRAAMGLGLGAQGAGVTIADVEYEWRPQHVELVSRGLAPPPANSLDPGFLAADHGSAVLGLLAGDPDGVGVTGLVTASEIRPVSPFASGGYRPAEAIADAAEALEAGDVLLIELQAGSGGRYLPIESLDTPEHPVRTEIRRAVDRGIVVVEPAGNGGLDIGTTRLPWLAGPAAEDHSGALIVGAGGSATDPSSSDLSWVGGSNYGARVDVQGVGAALVTSGYGGSQLGGDGDRAYTACFDGTSGASATVAAAAAALQSEAIARRGVPLTPDQVRDLLRATGRPQAGPSDRPIGPRPDVAAALASLDGVPPPADTNARPAPTPQGTGPATVVPVIAATADRPQRTAVSRVTARYARRGGRLTIRLKGLARGAKVTARGRAAKVVRGKIVLTRLKPGRIVVVVRPPARLRATHRALKVVVVVAPSGRVRVIRL